MVPRADDYQLVLIIGIVVRDVMDVQKARAWPEPTQHTVTVSGKDFFPNGIPAGVVVDPLRHFASQR